MDAQSYIKGLVKERIDKAKEALGKGVKEVFAPPGKTTDTKKKEKKKEKKEESSKYKNLEMGGIKSNYKAKEGMVRTNTNRPTSGRTYISEKVHDLFARARKNR